MQVLIFRSSLQTCSVKKVSLEISQNSQENTCARVTLLKKGLWHRCFPVNFVKFLGNTFLHRVPLVAASESSYYLLPYPPPPPPPPPPTISTSDMGLQKGWYIQYKRDP